jgi:hypothetical protein
MTTEELQLVPDSEQLPTKRADTVAIWNEYRAQAEKLKVTAETLTITSIEQIAEMKVARATRLALREVRIAVDHKRKELGEYHLRETQKINAAAKELRELIEPLEARLQDQEDFIERETLRIEDGRREARHAEIAPFLTGPLSVDLGKLPDADYAKMLADAKDLATLREERARKEKEAAEAQAKAEAEERERIAAENAKLKKEAEEAAAKAKAEREAAEAERKRIQAEAEARERAAAEKARQELEAAQQKAAEEARIAAEKARKEREAIEAKAKAERAAAEKKAKAEREAADAKAREERLAREKLEAEIAAKRAAEEKAEADRIAAEKAAANAPAKEKLTVFAHEVRLLALKTFSVNSNELVKEVADKTESFAKWVEKKAGEL